MSLVARCAVDQYPLLVGDILISALEEPDRPLDVPTIGDVRQVFPAGSGFVPSSLSQKIAIVDKHLAIGWAGSRIAAKTVIRELIERNSHVPLTNESLMEFFATVEDSIWEQGVGFVGFIKDHNGLSQFGFRYRNISTVAFGKVGLIGSGAGDAERLLQQLSGSTTPSQPINALERCLMAGLTLSGTLLASELSTAGSLSQYYGGGYEIVSLQNGCFTKLDHITFLFWKGTIDAQGFRIRPYQICRYSYLGDWLLIRTVTFTGMDRDSGRFMGEHRLYSVPPVHSNNASPVGGGALPPLSSRWLCNYLIFQIGNEYEVFTHINYVASDDAPIRFQESADGVAVAFKGEWSQNLMKTANELYCANAAKVHLSILGLTNDDCKGLAIDEGCIVFLGIGFPRKVGNFFCIPCPTKGVGFYSVQGKRHSENYPSIAQIRVEEIPKNFKGVPKIAGHFIYHSDCDAPIARLKKGNKLAFEALFNEQQIVFRVGGQATTLFCGRIPQDQRFTLVLEWSQSNFGIWISWIDSNNRTDCLQVIEKRDQ